MLTVLAAAVPAAAAWASDSHVLATPDPATTTVGLYSFPWETQVHADEISDAGIHTLRMGGQMDDATMTTVTLHDFEVLMVVGNGNRASYPSDESFVAAQIGKVDATLSRYGPGGSFFIDHPELPVKPIREIEVLNEPNFEIAGGNSTTAPLYAKVLRATYPHVKERWPSVTVVGFAAGDSSDAAPGFIEAVLKADPTVSHSFDVVSIHPYIQPTAPEAVRKEAWGSWSIKQSVDQVRQILTQYGIGSTPIWFTEIGWQISSEAGGRYDAGLAGLTESMQASYSIRADLLAAKLSVQRVYHMFTVDADGFNGGFYTASGPRLQATATRALIAAVGSDRFAVASIPSAAGTTALSVVGERDALVAWSDTGTSTQLDMDAPIAAAVRGLGGELSERQFEGTGWLRLSPQPIIVEDPSGVLRGGVELGARDPDLKMSWQCGCDQGACGLGAE